MAPEFIPTTSRYRVKFEDGSISALKMNNLTHSPDKLLPFEGDDSPQLQTANFVTYDVMESAFREGITGLVSKSAEHMGKLEDRIRALESSSRHIGKTTKPTTKDEGSVRVGEGSM